MPNLTAGAAAQLSHTIALLSAAIQGSLETFIVIDKRGRAHAVNGCMPLAAMFDASPEQVLREPAKFMVPAAYKELYRRVRNAVTRKPPGEKPMLERFTFSALVRGGRTVSMQATLIDCLADPQVGALIMRVGLDDGATSLESLTGSGAIDDDWPSGVLANKAAFMSHLQRVVEVKDRKIWQLERFARSVVRDRRHDYTLVLLELDRFKMLLGGFGRDILDALVQMVVTRITAVLRDRDVVAHLGGGEFGLVLHQVGNAERATNVADVIIKVLEERFDVMGHPITVAPVVGIATSERRYRTADEVVRDASAAASRAYRRRGRRREAFQTRIRVEDTKRIGLMADMHDCLNTDAFFLAYQPIIRIADESLAGFEALCRWRHPQLGNISPATFIPLAEETGLIRPIGRWVLEQACRDMAMWNASLSIDHPLVISVNVSALQLVDDQLVGEVDEVLALSKLAPQRLRLEITESAVLDNLEAVSDVINRLKSRGVTFSLDDFGTGYSSLSYLRLLPYDSLKIDRMFLRPRAGGGADSSIDDIAIVSAVVSLGKSLGMDVVAEGVESAEQLKILRRMGCEYAQGYHFSKPIERDKAAELIHTGRAW